MNYAGDPVMKEQKPDLTYYSESRKRDPYLDRRTGQDRREVYLLDYFFNNNPDRRSYLERRSKKERRSSCIRVDDWSSVCPEPEKNIETPPYVFLKK